MGRPLDSAKVFEAFRKHLIILHSEDSAEARKRLLKKIILKVERQLGEASGAEDFSRCMRFLKELGTGDASSHNNSSN